MTSILQDCIVPSLPNIKVDLINIIYSLYLYVPCRSQTLPLVHDMVPSEWDPLIIGFSSQMTQDSVISSTFCGPPSCHRHFSLPSNRTLHVILALSDSRIHTPLYRRLTHINIKYI